MKTWNDVTLEQFEQIEKLTDTIDIIGILERKTPLEMEELNLDQYKELVNKWSFIGQDKPNIVPTDIFILDGEIYSMINLNSVTVGEWDAMNTYSKKGDIRGMMSILYRKAKPSILDRIKIAIRLGRGRSKLKFIEVEPYNEKTSNELKRAIGKLPYNFVYSVSVFFLIMGVELARTTNSFLKEVVETQMDSFKNGEQSPS